MSLHQGGIYHYVKLPYEHRRLFCVQQNIGELIRLFWLPNNSLTPVERPDTKAPSSGAWLRRMRGYLGRVKHHARMLSAFLGYKFQGIPFDGVVQLPCYGQFCIPVHQGYKVFNVHRHVVRKVFNQHVKPSLIHHEIELLEQISRMGVSPSLKQWNVEEKWYEEEYVDGSLDSSYTPMDSSTVLQKFSDELVQPLIRLMLLQKPNRHSAGEYVLEMSGNWLKQGNPGAHWHNATSFMTTFVHRIQSEERNGIYCTFSHGDFVPANMLNTGFGLKIIDWEGAGRRSALFDFYSYFFYRPANRGVAVSTLLNEVREALPWLVEELGKTDQEISRNLNEREDVYRWTFYIEMLDRLMNRALSDTHLNMRNSIDRYIKAFEEYEGMLAHKGEIGQENEGN